MPDSPWCKYCDYSTWELDGAGDDVDYVCVKKGLPTEKDSYCSNWTPKKRGFKPMIYVTSDLHFCHDREFLFKPRGFENVWDMNKAIVKNWNDTVAPEDDVYVLGDIMLNHDDEGIRLLKSLKGKIHIILGNHDTNARIELYKQCYNVVEVVYATVLKYNKYRFYLSHYPTITTNLDESHFSQHLLNLYGHTHQKTNFFNDNPFMYHVGADSHNCTPVSLDTVLEEMKAKYKECGDML